MASAPEVGRALREADPSLQALPFETLAESVDVQLLILRLGAIILGTCGFLAMLLALVGLAGVVSQAVGQRTREIGVRLALGARASQVLRVVLGRGLMLASSGVAAGGVVAVGASLTLFQIPFVSYLLFGISPLDPIVLAGCGALMLGVTLVAGWLPARRALRIDPIEALRCD